MGSLVPVENKIIKPEEAITLVRVKNPLNPRIDRESKVIDYFGESILTIKNKYFPIGLPVIVSINGKMIQEHDFDKVFLRHGDYIVFYPTIQGGGGNNMFRAIAFLALAVAVMFVAPWAAAAIGPGMGIVAGTAGMATLTGLIGTGITVVGGLLINAMLPPTTPDQAANSIASSGKTTYSFNPHTTQEQGISIPKIYGQLRTHGNVITAFNYNERKKSTANLLICLGMGPIEYIYDHKLNKQRIGSMKDIEIDTRIGEISQPVIPNFDDTKTENGYSVLISHVKDWKPSTVYGIEEEVAVIDETITTSVVSYKFISNNKGRSGTDFPAGPYTIGQDYTDNAVSWYCDSKYPYQVTTVGNDFDALEIELNFPRGLCAIQDGVQAHKVKYNVEISPTGQNAWLPITRKPQGFVPWSPNLEVYTNDIIASGYGQLFEIVSPDMASGKSVTTGKERPPFPKVPYSACVEDIGGESRKVEYAYIGNGAETSFGSNIATYLNGDTENGYDLSVLNTADTYLYLLIKQNKKKIQGTQFLTYIFPDTKAAVPGCAGKIQYVKTKAGGWSSSIDFSTFDTTEEDLIIKKIGSGKIFREKTINGVKGIWVRLYFATKSASNTPKIAFLKSGDKKEKKDFIVYKSIAHNYGTGTWSAGYQISSSGFLGPNEDRLWVEVKNNNETDYKAHVEGADFDARQYVLETYYSSYDYTNSSVLASILISAGYKARYARVQGVKWRYLTGTVYKVDEARIENSASITKATTSPFYHLVKTPPIFPHGQYDVRIERVSGNDPAATSVSSQMYLTNVREITFDDFSYPRQALVGVKALATDKLSSSLDFSAIVKGLIVKVNRPDEVIGTDGYNYRCISPHTSAEATNKPITGTSYSTYWEQGGNSAVDNNITWTVGTGFTSTYKWVTEYNTNPAWVCYDLLSQPVLGLPSEIKVGTTSFECVISHTASATNKPGEGVNWSLYWQPSGKQGIDTDWALGSAYVARPVHRYEGISTDRLNLTSFRDWADYCDELVYDENGTLERRHEFNGIFEEETTLWESALKVAEMSRTSLIWNGVELAAVSDKLITLPDDAVQLFSSGNTVADSFQETFLPMEERIDELEISFLNRDKDWERDTISIYNPDYDRPSNKASIQPYGITKSSQAWRHAQYLINRNRYLKRTIEFDVDLEAIACTIGDVFYFHNDTPRWGLAGGRVVSCSDDGSYLELDQNITMTSTSSYGVMVRLNDDTLVTKDVDNLVSDTELITNGSFSANTDNWTAQHGSLANISGGKSGNCLELTVPGGEGIPYAQQTLSVINGKTYIVSAWVKSGTSGNESAKLSIYETGAVEIAYENINTSNSWQFISYTWTATVDTIRVILHRRTNTAGTMLFDEVSVREVLDDTGGESAVIAVTVPFTDLPQQYDPYSFGVADSEAKAFRIINVSQSADQRAKITAIEYDADVYGDDLQYSLVDEGNPWEELDPIKPVTDLIIRQDFLSVPGGSRWVRRLEISFDRPANCTNYKSANVWYKEEKEGSGDAGEWVFFKETQDTILYIDSVKEGYRYTVCVLSVSKGNVEAKWKDSPVASIVISSEPVKKQIGSDNLTISGLTVYNNPNSTTFLGRDCKILWNPINVSVEERVAGGFVTASSIADYGVALNTATTDTATATAIIPTTQSLSGTLLENVIASSADKGAGVTSEQTWFKDYEVKVFDTSGNLLRTEYVIDPQYVYTYEKNFEDNNGSPKRQFEIRVSARDINLNVTPHISMTMSNPLPIAPSITVSRYRDDAIVDISPVYNYDNTAITDTDIAGYLTYACITTTAVGSWIISDSYLINKGKDTRVVLGQLNIDTIQVAVGAYDVYGEN